jgi:hypothetical protein
MGRAIYRTPLIAEVWVQFQVNPCRICRGHGSGETGFSPGTLTLSCYYHSTKIPQSALSLYEVNN